MAEDNKFGIDSRRFRQRVKQMQKSSQGTKHASSKSPVRMDWLPCEQVCALSVISMRNKKQCSVSTELWLERETERAFVALHGSFGSVASSFLKDTVEAGNPLMILQYPLLFTMYTLIRRPLALDTDSNSNSHTTKYAVFLMADTQTQRLQQRADSLTCSALLDRAVCNALSIVHQTQHNDDDEKEPKQRKLSLSAMQRIMEHVFTGNRSVTQPAFVGSMRSLMDTKKVCSAETQLRLQSMFENMLEHGSAVDVTDLLAYFSPFTRQHTAQDSTKRRLAEWRRLRQALGVECASGGYRGKASEVGKSQEAMALWDHHLALGDDEAAHWRARLGRYREAVRVFQAALMEEAMAENVAMKKRLERVGKRQRGQVSRQQWLQQNAHLLLVEQEYYALLQQLKVQRVGLHKAQEVVKLKDAEIEELKQKVLRKEREQGRGVVGDERKVAGSRSHSALKLVELKGEIKRKRFEVQKQLNLISRGSHHR